ncbi:MULTISPECIES: CDGSH iron-sulfur domain-containing protein [Streptomyces microflavus subgroup]|uniref:CDGSH iron-sulfur domain-containing protein n=1 Tax=Streptomyces microflavus subgroup TaxID=1482601 RepID=UPI00099E706B|nr:CDGSH iron-sulfur domain-containing protein [Streptomyces luridiscabiei]WTF73508.1 CDGSH iron-sulfur domain-containing protein [Streptomyces microflavus]
MPSSPDRPARVTLGAEGPLLVEGPVEVVGDDGTLYTSRRFTAAICTCRRTRTYPWCDTSHRRRVKPARAADDEPEKKTDEPEKAHNTRTADETRTMDNKTDGAA